MPRHILSETDIHPAIREKISGLNTAIVDEVKAAMVANTVVVVGMRQNPLVKKARTLLAKQGIAFMYLEYGSYFSEWRKRNSLKMWTGWPTFPMVFIHGQLIGGFEDLARLHERGALATLLKPQ